MLSGAGLSTESGIPDYRGPTGALRTNKPMTYQEFAGSPDPAPALLGPQLPRLARRSRGPGPTTGTGPWPRLQQRGLLDGIITQNVDGLHQAAGATDVIELHGGLDLVVCLGCGRRESRAALDTRLRAANPDFGAAVTRINPDGDAELRR